MVSQSETSSAIAVWRCEKPFLRDTYDRLKMRQAFDSFGQSCNATRFAKTAAVGDVELTNARKRRRAKTSETPTGAYPLADGNGSANGGIDRGQTSMLSASMALRESRSPYGSSALANCSPIAGDWGARAIDHNIRCCRRQLHAFRQRTRWRP